MNHRRHPLSRLPLSHLLLPLLLLYAILCGAATAAPKDPYDPGSPAGVVLPVLHALSAVPPGAVDALQRYDDILAPQVNMHVFLGSVLLRAPQGMDALDEAGQERLATLLRRHLIATHLDLLGQLGRAIVLRQVGGAVDVSLGSVVFDARRGKGRRVRVQVLTARGWSDWKISDLAVGDEMLSERCRAVFASEIAAGGAPALLARLEADATR
ncbi:hypothetical protein [Pseudoduganella chitinolytica]|uniref:ABC transporter substrate-binding protein n=1 Tax=Pseudoduganella chitinolytica TaxID=34070 RepID=A0ABY8BL73_9BURK|nr:hypothetical protein [Pseudoduganella chitinolytica]WEF35119.1 hypothetical protein PX653_10255 [Pseudoduganella chitinolytica]